MKITKQKAKEILEYCSNYLIPKGEDLINFKTSNLYKEMIKEISFLIDVD